jgi:hypothetical protein
MHFVLLGAFLFLQYSGIIPYCKKIEAGFEGATTQTSTDKGNQDKKAKKE